MKLARLLEQHDKNLSVEGLALSFGDSYLLKHNRIFANIRKTARAAGASFSTDRNNAYEVLPLSQLEGILERKLIPYSDNVSVLREVESKIQTGTEWDDISDGLKKSHLFHESCHLVARTQSAHLPAAKDVQHRALHLLLEESFANTCELLAVIEAQDQYHRIFFEWNSYTCLFEERTHLKNAAAEFGEFQLFRFFALCYIHANFLREGLDEKTLGRVITLAEIKPDARQLKTLRALAKTPFTLNPRFRDVTSGFYFKLLGIQTPRRELFAFDFMHSLEGAPYRNHLEKLTKIALKK